MKTLLSTGAAVIALGLSSCGGSGGEKSTTTTTPAAPPSAATFPPKFLACMADQGVEISRPDDIHGPGAQQAFQACLPFLHGEGAP
jgi:hypothetical protein